MRLSDAIKLLLLLGFVAFCLQPCYGGAGDTLKGLHSIRQETNADEKFWGGRFIEFYFPQYLISNAVKQKKARAYRPGKFPFGRPVEFSKKEEDSLFTIRTWQPLYDDEGNETGEKVLDVYEKDEFFGDGYEFMENLFADEKNFKLCLDIIGLNILNTEYEPSQRSVPVYFFVPPGGISIRSGEFLVLKDQKDTVVLKNLDTIQRSSLGKIMMSCLGWCTREKSVVLVNGIRLGKKEAKKILRTGKKKDILNGISRICFSENWFLDPSNCAFQKEVTSLELMDETGKVIYSFQF